MMKNILKMTNIMKEKKKTKTKITMPTITNMMEWMKTIRRYSTEAKSLPGHT